MTQKTLEYNDLQITPADVYEQMGYHGAEPDAATRHETAEIISEVRQWLRPQFCYLVVRELPAFDMGKIIDDVSAIYAVMETCNVYGFLKMDHQFVQDFMDGFKNN